MEQVKAEPVADWLQECTDGRVSSHTITMLNSFRRWYDEYRPLYTTPQPASSQLLTVEDVKIIWNATWKQGYPDVHDFTARINAIIGAGERETAIANPQPAAVDGLVEADAARYRWLRDHSCPPHNFYVSVPVEFEGVKYGASEVDAYIDEARQAIAQIERTEDGNG